MLYFLSNILTNSTLKRNTANGFVEIVQHRVAFVLGYFSGKQKERVK
jgi:hypothetical protein